MKSVLLAVLAGVAWGLPTSGLEGVRIAAPAGWPVWMAGERHVVFLAPDPEVEATMLQFAGVASASPWVTLGAHVGAASEGREVVRISPVHEGTTVEGLAVLAQVVVLDDREAGRRFLWVAVVQGVGRAAVAQLETGTEELLGRYFGVLMRSAAGVRFGGSGELGPGGSGDPEE